MGRLEDIFILRDLMAAWYRQLSTQRQDLERMRQQINSSVATTKLKIVPPQAAVDAVERPPPARVHKRPCKHCPSAHYPPDEESLFLEDAVRCGLIDGAEVAFVCAWRPQALCRGVVDRLKACGWEPPGAP